MSILTLSSVRYISSKRAVYSSCSVCTPSKASIIPGSYLAINDSRVHRKSNLTLSTTWYTRTTSSRLACDLWNLLMSRWRSGMYFMYSSCILPIRQIVSTHNQKKPAWSVRREFVSSTNVSTKSWRFSKADRRSARPEEVFPNPSSRRTNFMQVDQGLLKPSPKQPSSLRCFTLVE